ncbi:LamG domain-containing protein [Zoogloea sp.]|uniref:LamG domain-containing protein n=1 Tax=Zoogloea sp. TaxID=49181 RepID=UPI0031FD57D3
MTLSTLARGSTLAVLLSCGPSLSQAATLLHYYDFNTDLNPGAPLVDLAGSANGTLQGGAQTQNGVLSLNGQDAYVQFAGMIIPATGSYSVTFNLARNSEQSGSFVEWLSQGQSGGPGFYIGTSPSGGIRVGDNWTPGASPTPAGVLAHYALVVDASSNLSTLYIDGINVANVAIAIGTGSGGSPTRLGRQFDPADEFFNGSMDELRIFDGALDDSAVAALANPPPTRVPEPAGLALLSIALATMLPHLTARRRN